MIVIGKNISCNPSLRKLREIDSFEFPESLFGNFDVFSCMKNQIELPSEVADLEIQFVKANLYENGSHYKQDFQSRVCGKKHRFLTKDKSHI